MDRAGEHRRVDQPGRDGVPASPGDGVEAGCGQPAIVDHFESVSDRLVAAALAEVSTTRMAGCHQQLARASSISGLAAAARAILAAGKDAAYVRVVVEMITAAYSVPEVTERVAALLEPWRGVTEQAVLDKTGSPARLLDMLAGCGCPAGAATPADRRHGTAASTEHPVDPGRQHQGSAGAEISQNDQSLHYRPGPAASYDTTNA